MSQRDPEAVAMFRAGASQMGQELRYFADINSTVKVFSFL